ncbi:hypothetical protein BJX70DRAFT_409282 [Aspergillus crustosus]
MAQCWPSLGIGSTWIHTGAVEVQLEESQTRFIAAIEASLARHDSKLEEINQTIWSNPELAYEEHDAHNNICKFFEDLNDPDYSIRRQAYGLETAFEIEFKHGTEPGRTVAFNAEYDALPGMGHACGHNLIATSSIAAFLATCDYTVRLLGTPAEESGGGKCHLLDAGAYKDHPSLLSIVTAAKGGFLANDKVKVTFTGKPAHAAVAPWEGINALDAVVAAYVNISLLRQQLLPSQKVHGVIVNGGDRPNVIPMSASVDYYIRSPTIKTLKPLTEKIVKCFESAATATGCTVDFEWGPSYADLKTNTPICESYVVFSVPAQDRSGGGSTDMGNVSYAVPGFHGIFTIATDGVNHTPQFTAGVGSLESYRRAMHCAAGMAVVACRILDDDSFAEEVKVDFEKDL